LAEDDLEPIDEGGPVAKPEQPDTPENYGAAAEDPHKGDPAAPKAPNSFYWPFWRPKTKGERVAYISWQSDSPIAVLAFVILVALLAAMLAFGIIDACTPGPLPWVADVMKGLGQAILTVVGTIVGASVTTKKGDGK
jgi:hypothetical protein